jgi:pimeloyl-ACP methyl ester carboxylesterase
MKSLKNLFLYSFFITTNLVFAQVQDSISYTYAALPPSIFPTGLLLDQSSIYHYYQGTDASPLVYDGGSMAPPLLPSNFEIAYHALYYAQRLGTNGLFAGNKPPHLQGWGAFNAFDSTLAQTVDVPLHLQWIALNRLSEFAIDSGYFDIRNDQFVLLDSIVFLNQNLNISYLNPDADSLACLGVVLDTVYLAGSNHLNHFSTEKKRLISFEMPSHLVQHNLGTINDIQVDFADGIGFRPIQLDQIYTIQYSTKSNTIERDIRTIRIKAISGTKTAIAAINLNIIYNAPKADVLFHTNKLKASNCVPPLKPRKDARVSVRYGVGHKSLRRPLILVEGFEGTPYEYGNITFESLSTGYIFDKDGQRIYQHMESLAFLYDSLKQEAIDIVHIDFRESKLSVKENAYNVLKVIEWVQNQKLDDGVIIVGASMGGLIARVALNLLEESGCCHPIIAYGTYDTPHNGAHIPIGVQQVCKTMSEDLSLVPSARNPWNKALNSTAARQMLINHLNPDAAQDRAELLSWLGNDQPKGVRTFAISNGNDLLLPNTLADSKKRWLSGGMHQDIVIRHAIGSNQDSINFNKNGHRINMPTWGHVALAHPHQSNYLYTGSPFLNYWRYRNINWYATKRALLAAKLYQYSQSGGPYAGQILNGIPQFQLFTNSKLQQKHSKASSKQNLVFESNYVNDLDESSGSTTSTLDAFMATPWLFDVWTTEHTFIPTYSALDIGPLYKHLPSRGKMNDIPFDTYWSPGLLTDQNLWNQSHIQASAELNMWILQTLRGIYLKSPLNISGYYNLAKSFNTHSSYRSDLSDLVVSMTGELHLGGSGPIGTSSSAVVADGQQNLRFFVGANCSAKELIVQGKLILGEDKDHKATLTIKSGSELILLQGSELVLMNNSKLVIEKGASLKVHPGAMITWDNASIHLEGTLNLVSGASFYPVGSGSFWAQGGDIVALNGGVVRFENSLLNVQDNLEVPLSLSAFDLQDCSVRFMNGASCLVYSNAIVNQTRSSFVGASKAWMGWKFYGTADINSSHFEGGSPAVLCTNSSTVGMVNNVFSNALEGVICDGGLSDFDHNIFNNCQLGADVDSTGNISNLSVTNCDLGVRLRGHQSSVTSCSFVNNSLGLEIIGGSIRMECNEFTYNTTGLQQEGGSLFLGNNAANSFHYNATALELVAVDDFKLNSGQNQINANTNFDLHGTFSASATLSSDPNGPFVLGNYNSFSGQTYIDLRQGRVPVSVYYNQNLSPSIILCTSKSNPGKQTDQFALSQEKSFAVFPNPWREGPLTIKILGSDSTSRIRLIDINGSLIDQINIEPNITEISYDFEGPTGVYILQWITDNQLESLRLIKK